MENQKQALLEVKQLHTGFYINKELYYAIEDIHLTISPKEVVCIVGESGCGKSVLSLSIMQLLPPLISEISAGEILFEGKDLVGKTTKEMNTIRGRDISMIFQEPMTALNPVFTIGSHLIEAFRNHVNVTKKEAMQKSVELLRQVGISRPETIVDDYPHQLSGGMRQRVMIAIAIALNPKLLIADEPTTALDVTIQAQILDLLKQIHEDHDMSIVFVTHDLGVVAEMADQVVVMYAGQIVERSLVVELFQNTKHPYTEALLGSVPHMDQEVEVLHAIDGVVPAIQHMPEKGCRFADRCHKAFEDCAHISPQLAEVNDQHEVRCLLYDACYPKEEAGKEGVK